MSIHSHLSQQRNIGTQIANLFSVGSLLNSIVAKDTLHSIPDMDFLVPRYLYLIFFIILLRQRLRIISTLYIDT